MEESPKKMTPRVLSSTPNLSSFLCIHKTVSSGGHLFLSPSTPPSSPRPPKREITFRSNPLCFPLSDFFFISWEQAIEIMIFILSSYLLYFLLSGVFVRPSFSVLSDGRTLILLACSGTSLGTRLCPYSRSSPGGLLPASVFRFDLGSAVGCPSVSLPPFLPFFSCGSVSVVVVKPLLSHSTSDFFRLSASCPELSLLLRRPFCHRVMLSAPTRCSYPCLLFP